MTCNVAEDRRPLLLTLILLTWSTGWAPNNASRRQMGFNLAFKGLIVPEIQFYFLDKCPGNCARSFMFMFMFNYALQHFKAYCVIWVRRSNFCHQASPRVSPRESTQRRKVKLWARNIREFCLNADLHFTFMDLLHAVTLRHGTDGFTSPPKEGVLRTFSP